jgi:signal transduction histidine kinase
MYEIIDKILLLICCTTLYLFTADTGFVVVPVIIAIVLSSLFIYFEDKRVRLAGNILYCLLCFFFPSFIVFLPLVMYDILNTRYQYAVIVIPFIFIYHVDYYKALIISFTIAFLVVSFLLKYKTDNLKKLRSEYNDLRDSSAKMSQLLEEKNQTLLQNQDYEINLATLNERNRISKELHDSIGHMLSRALLQVGALLTITGDELTKEGLTTLKESLSDGMDQIRSSIHNMYDDSIDLYLQIEYLVKHFTFCPITYDYDIKDQPSLQLKHSFIAMTKECLSNIMRHSNATRVSILLREHPAMYQLIIHDNGTMDELTKNTLIKAFEKQEYDEGMGLRNIVDRVKSFGGNINITLDNGYRIFISIPKKSREEKWGK